MSSDRPALTGISSMASRQVLTRLAEEWTAKSGQHIQLTAVGGVDAAKRVQAGEGFDLVFLASDALEKLHAQGHIAAGSIRPLMRSGVAVAVQQGDTLPDITTEASLKAAVLAAPSIGYSTGPSGTALLALFAQWGLLEQLKPRLIQAPPGVPVAQLLAQGEVALGFQQLSELLHVPGIVIAGSMPASIQIETIFAGAVAATCKDPQRQSQAKAALDFMASPQAEAAIAAQGMRPA